MQDKYKFDGVEDSELRNQMEVCRLGVELEAGRSGCAQRLQSQLGQG